MLVLLATVILGTFEQAMRGNVSLPLAVSILFGSSLATQMGAVATQRVSNRSLRVIFGILVRTTACIVATDALTFFP